MDVNKWLNDCISKTVFRDQHKADCRAGQLKKKTKLPFRSYYCDKCFNYHLTSKPRRQQTFKKNDNE